MITYLQTKHRFIYSFIEWEVVNKEGQFQDHGEYVYIQNLWVHPKFRSGFAKGCIEKLIAKMNKHEFMKNVNWVYWNNLQRDALVGPFPRNKLARRGIDV